MQQQRGQKRADYEKQFDTCPSPFPRKVQYSMGWTRKMVKKYKRASKETQAIELRQIHAPWFVRHSFKMSWYGACSRRSKVERPADFWNGRAGSRAHHRE